MVVSVESPKLLSSKASTQSLSETLVAVPAEGFVQFGA